MKRRMPYAIGKAHGLAGLPQYYHRHNGRRYDSSNANDAYVRGYGIGTRERIEGGQAGYNLFDMFGVVTPIAKRPLNPNRTRSTR